MHRFSLYLALLIFSGTLEADSLHPLVKLENIYPSNKVELKISAIAFQGDNLFVTVISPDRQNQAPFLKGEILKIPAITSKNDRSAIKAERIMGGLYEPTALAVFNGKLYVGENPKI